MKQILLIMGVIYSLSSIGQVTGTFIDPRDNKTYKTVKIGKQTWMAENLAFQASGCWAYNNDLKYVKVYGYLYDWETAMRVCPRGWHLPSVDEWQMLIDYHGDKRTAGGWLREKGTVHWERTESGVTNESGFTALPAGYRDNLGIYFDLGLSCEFWSSNYFPIQNAAHSQILVTYGIYTNRYTQQINYGLCVRCIKDN